jgi:L-amino acid N-acyltransferase YncA
MTRYLVRDATLDDLDRIIQFEIAIAVISFDDKAITDTGVHGRRVSAGVKSADDITMVVVDKDAPGEPLGWAWMSARSNSLTGERYGNFRSLATAEHPDRTAVGELLLDSMVRRAREMGVTEIVGKVHVANLPMRALYKKFDFESVHLTMRRILPAGEE